MIDLQELEAKRDTAADDKADLFDFYHDNWDNLVAELLIQHGLAQDAMEKYIALRGYLLRKVEVGHELTEGYMLFTDDDHGDPFVGSRIDAVQHFYQEIA